MWGPFTPFTLRTSQSNLSDESTPRCYRDLLGSAQQRLARLPRWGLVFTPDLAKGLVLLSEFLPSARSQPEWGPGRARAGARAASSSNLLSFLPFDLLLHSKVLSVVRSRNLQKTAKSWSHCVYPSSPGLTLTLNLTCASRGRALHRGTPHEQKKKTCVVTLAYTPAPTTKPQPPLLVRHARSLQSR